MAHNVPKLSLLKAMLFLFIPVLLTAVWLFHSGCSNIEDIADASYDLPELGCGADTIGNTWYIDPASGNDSNAGTESAPWRSIHYALSNMQKGDTLIFRGGIYRVTNDIRFDISGNGPHDKTIYKAYPEERAIITGAYSNGRDQLPDITIKGDYIRFERLWFGGFWFAGEGVEGGRELQAYGGAVMDTLREFVGCTFFGFSSIRMGLMEWSWWKDNRFIRTGTANDPPMLFFSGIYGESQHAILDGNILLHGRGYGICGWHSFFNFLITRNFIGYCWGGFITDGTCSEASGDVEGQDHLLANNIFWKNGDESLGSMEPGFENVGATLIAHSTHFLNNVMVHNHINVSRSDDCHYEKLNNFIVSGNVLYNVPHGIGSTPEDNDYFEIDSVDPLGADETAIDNAIAALNTSFSQPVSTIINDSSIESNFALIKNLQIASDHTLYQNTTAWYDSTVRVNPGTDTEFPFSCPNDYWDNFSKRRLRHHQCSDNSIQ